uniref:Uncharacterized protein n=1 Tax=Arundo donax TaxID=35708 RepID=A0A0A9CAS2_ARUDO
MKLHVYALLRRVPKVPVILSMFTELKPKCVPFRGLD